MINQKNIALLYGTLNVMCVYMSLTCIIVLDLIKIVKVTEEKPIEYQITLQKDRIMKQITYVDDLYIDRLKIKVLLITEMLWTIFVISKGRHGQFA